MCFHQLLNASQLTPVEAIVSFEVNWIQPELRLIFAGFYVNVRRLLALVAEKVETIGPHSQHGRHQSFLISRMYKPSCQRDDSLLGQRPERTKEGLQIPIVSLQRGRSPHEQIQPTVNDVNAREHCDIAFGREIVLSTGMLSVRDPF